MKTTHFFVEAIIKILLCIIAFSTLACSEKSKVEEEKVAHKVQTAKHSTPKLHHYNRHWPTYTVSVPINMPPYAFRDANKHLSGFLIDLMDGIAARQKFNIKYIMDLADEPFAMRQKHGYDVIISKVPAGAKTIQGTVLYQAKTALLQQNGQSARIMTSALRTPYVNHIASRIGAQVQAEKTDFRALEQVLLKRASFILGDKNTLKYYWQILPENYNRMNLTFITNEAMPNIDYIYTVGKNDNAPVISEEFNTGLERLRASGKYRLLTQRWFNKEGDNE